MSVAFIPFLYFEIIHFQSTEYMFKHFFVAAALTDIIVNVIVAKYYLALVAFTSESHTIQNKWECIFYTRLLGYGFSFRFLLFSHSSSTMFGYFIDHLYTNKTIFHAHIRYSHLFFCICYYCCLLYAECPKGNLSILHIILLCKIQCCLCFVVVCICSLNSKLADVLHSNYFQLGYFQTTLFKSFLCLNICKKKKRKKINDINLYLNLNFVSSSTTITNHRNLSKHMHIFVDNRKVGIFRSPFLSEWLWICKYAEQTFL